MRQLRESRQSKLVEKEMKKRSCEDNTSEEREDGLHSRGIYVEKGLAQPLVPQRLIVWGRKN
jgi:hypothetical protein